MLFYWQKLSARCSVSQTFYIFICILFQEYQKIGTADAAEAQKYIWNGIRRPKEEFSRENFQGLFSKIPDYDLKESIVQLGERLDWQMAREDPEVGEIIADLSAWIARHLCWGTGEKLQKLDELLGIIMELSGGSGLYSAAPQSIQTLLTELCRGGKVRAMADFTCKCGILGLSLWNLMADDEKNTSYYGTDMEPVLCDIARIMACFHGVREKNIIWQDILAVQAGEDGKSFDFIVSDLPKGNNQSLPINPEDVRTKECRKKSIYSDWLHILNVLHHLEKNGKAVVIATSGALIRENEKEFRRTAVDQDWVEAVISLPPNLYPNTRISSEILFFNKKKELRRKNKVLFVDISKYFYRENRNFYSITEEGIQAAVRAFREFEEIPGISVIRGGQEIDGGICSWKPLSYIDAQGTSGTSFDGVPLEQIAEVTRGVQLKKEEEERYCQGGDYCFLNIKDMDNGYIRYEGARRIRAKSVVWERKYKIREDDILITSKGTTFKVTIVGANPPDSLISGNLTRIRVDRDKYHPYILYEYLISGQGQQALERIQSGTTIRVLNNANLSRLEIPRHNYQLMCRVGDKLKKKQEQYEAEKKCLQDTYLRERELLLELLKEDEREDEKKDGKNFHQSQLEK